MKLYYSWKPNLGDSLNPWLFERLLPDMLDENDTELLLGIGTILNHKLPKTPRTHIFGSGYGYGYGMPPRLDPAQTTIHCVRGPVTAAALGLPATAAVADPAILIRRFVPEASGDHIGFMPHFESLEIGSWTDVCARAGLVLLDPRGDVDTVLNQMQRCKLIVTEAMHGAIISDALRIPWIPVVPLNRRHAAKWADWFLSMNLECQVHEFASSNLCEVAAARVGAWKASVIGVLNKPPLGQRLYSQLTAPQPHRAAAEASAEALDRPLENRIVPMLLAPVPRLVRSCLDERMRDRAARRLMEIARQGPVISDFTLLETRCQQLEERLESLRGSISLCRFHSFPGLINFDAGSKEALR